MSRWFRHYAGMMRDDKMVRVALRSKQPVERVLWVWGAILESAAEVDQDGQYDFDCAEAAYFLRADEADVSAILDALTDAGRVADGFVVKWGNRQFASDSSKERVAAYRQRKRAERSDGNAGNEAGNGAVTLQEQPGNTPETEAETEEENPPKPPRKRGGDGSCLIPEDWALPPVAELAPQARACAEQWTSGSYRAHGDAFIGYWRTARKKRTDWKRTWENRIIEIHHRVMQAQKFGNAPPDPDRPLSQLSPDQHRANLERSIELNTRMGKLVEADEARRKLAALGGNPAMAAKVSQLAGSIGRAA